jgi:hypothetical protein
MGGAKPRGSLILRLGVRGFACLDVVSLAALVPWANLNTMAILCLIGGFGITISARSATGNVARLPWGLV